MSARGTHGVPLPVNSAPYTAIVYVHPDDGRRVRAPLHADELKDVAFEHAVPIRKFPSYRGRVAHQGRYWFSRTRSHVKFESRFEMAALMTLDHRADVKAVSSNPFWLLWPSGAKPVRHAPDFFVRLQDGGVLIVDVKPAARMTDGDRIQHRRTRDVCDEMNWCYEEFTSLNPVVERNLRVISAYGHPRFALPDTAVAAIEAKLRAAGTSGSPLSEVIDAIGRYENLTESCVLAGTYHMLWTNQVQADLGRTLCWHTRVTL